MKTLAAIALASAVLVAIKPVAQPPVTCSPQSIMPIAAEIFGSRNPGAKKTVLRGEDLERFATGYNGSPPSTTVLPDADEVIIWQNNSAQTYVMVSKDACVILQGQLSRHVVEQWAKGLPAE